MQKYEQVVSLAGVYDALVSDRVYKKAYSHEKAIQMILNGERGKKEQVAMHSEKPLELAGGQKHQRIHGRFALVPVRKIIPAI